MTWRVWSLDVWGNAEDGWEVNDRREVGRLGLLPQQASDREVLAALVHNAMLRGSVKLSDVNIDGDDEMLTVDDFATGAPLYQLTWED